MQFGLYAFRFSFLASEPVYFPEGKSANILRGALGTIFREIACVPECLGARHCERAQECPYARTFEPFATVKARIPSGLSDWPRPFVFRAAHLDGCRFSPGARFHFDLHLFDLKDRPLEYLVSAFGALASEGIGPGRARVELIDVSQLDEQRNPSMELREPLQLDLAAAPDPVGRIRVRFRTPTELKRGAELGAEPDFATLAARIRDRISTLRTLYQDGPLTLDFRAFGERAALVRMTSCRIEHREILRRSSRTGQTHPIGGFVGEAEYEGDLAEFVPYLRAAEWTGVGRQTVWGKGEIAVEILG